MKYINEMRMSKRTRWFIAAVTAVLFLCIIVSISTFQTALSMRRQQIGLILSGSRDLSGWDKVHYEGLKKACLEMGADLVVRENIHPNVDSYQRVLQEFSDLRIKRVVVTRHNYPDEIRTLFRQYPDIDFVLTTTDFSEKNMFSCSARLYEARYLAGVLAGSQTETGIIGYVAPYECPEVNRQINAFAVGVFRANPDARIKLVWSGGWTEEREKVAVEHLARASADVLTYHQDGRQIADAAEQMGIDYIDSNEFHPEHKHCLTAITADWENIYASVLKRELNYDEIVKTDGFASWKGLIHNLVSLAPYSEWVMQKSRENVARAKREFYNGRVIFGGEIYDNHGVIRSAENQTISTFSIRTNMNWLIRGVEIIE